MSLKASAAAVALASVVAAAQPPPQEPGKPQRAQARLTMPRGPIKITAERADIEQRETALYRGNVRMTSADLTLTGDRLELRQPARGQIEAKLTGRPARLMHKAAGDAPPVAASAQQIVYDARAGTVEMTGGAHLERGTDVLTGQSIRYELDARRISAKGVDGGQVQIILQPPNGRQKPQNTQP